MALPPCVKQQMAQVADQLSADELTLSHTSRSFPPTTSNGRTQAKSVAPPCRRVHKNTWSIAKCDGQIWQSARIRAMSVQGFQRLPFRKAEVHFGSHSLGRKTRATFAGPTRRSLWRAKLQTTRGERPEQHSSSTSLTMPIRGRPGDGGQQPHNSQLRVEVDKSTLSKKCGVGVRITAHLACYCAL